MSNILDELALDFETPYGDDFSVVDLGYSKYARDERCVPYCISVSDGKEAWAGHPRDFNFDALKGKRLVSQNAAFDEEIALAGTERGLFPAFEHAEWVCSANMSAYLWNERSLAGAAKMGLGIEVDKGVRDRAKNKSWEDMVREGWSDAMLRYARLDAQHCIHLWQKHSHKWPDWERRLSRLTIDQGRYGVRIDVVRLHHYIEVLQRVIFNATNNLPWIARGRKPGSPIGIAEECRSSGIPQQPVKQDDEEAAEEWEEEFAPRFPWVMALRNLRKAKKSLAFLETMKLRLRADDTMAFSLKYAGAHTLRWSGDSGLSLHNLPKSPFFVRPDYTFELDKTKIAALDELFDAGKEIPGIAEILDIRGLIIAREGCKLAPTDLSQIEPRVLNWTAGNTEILAEVVKGMAIYESHARRTMGWTGGELKKQNKPKYSLAKVRVLSFGFGCGWEKAIVSALKEKIDLTEGDEEYARKAAVDGTIHYRIKDSAKKYIYSSAPLNAKVTLGDYPDAPKDSIQPVIFIEREHWKTQEKYLEVQTVYGQRARAEIRDFRSSNPLIEGQWRTLQKMLEDSIGGDLVLELPSGRSLTYRDIKKSRRKMVDKETGETYERTVLTYAAGFKRKVTYGSKLCENITQAIARDVFCHNMLLCEDAGIRTLFTVHDEIVPEVPKDFDSKIITRLMSTTPSWIPGLPVGAETKETQRYLK
jgi:hypothetical protein